MRQILTLGIWFFVLSLSGKTWCQKDFATGFIITQASDTIYGFIRDRENPASDRECIFKRTTGSDAVKYKAEDLKSYQFTNGNLYVSKTIQLNGDSACVFLGCLLDGIADIYFLNIKGSPHYYIEKSGLGLQELIREEEKVVQKPEGVVGANDEKEFQVNHDLYKGILHVAFADDRPLYNKVDQTTFTARNLVRITKEYHKDVCDDYSCIDYTRNLKTKISYSLESGISENRTGLKSVEGYGRDFSFIYGIKVYIHPALISKNLDFAVGLMNSAHHLDHTYTGEGTDIYGSDFGIKLITDYDELQIPVSIRYTFSYSKIKPFIEAGYDHNILLNRKSSAFRRTNTGELLPGYSEMSIYQAGVFAGTGLSCSVSHKTRINLTAEYELRLPKGDLRVNSLCLGLGAEFNLSK